MLSLPVELRLRIFDILLNDHRLVIPNKQPSNAHLVLLSTCKQFLHEAGALTGFSKYVSLSHERQISSFLQHAPDSFVSQIEYADVANDGRVVTLSQGTQACPLIGPRYHTSSELGLRLFPCPVSVYVSTRCFGSAYFAYSTVYGPGLPTTSVRVLFCPSLALRCLDI